MHPYMYKVCLWFPNTPALRFLFIGRTFCRKVLAEQLVLGPSRERQDVNGCCICHSTTKPFNLLVLLAPLDGQPEAWTTEGQRRDAAGPFPLNPRPRTWTPFIAHLGRCCSHGPDPDRPPACCQTRCSGRRRTDPRGARWRCQRCHSRLSYTHTPLSLGQSPWQCIQKFLEVEI